MKRNFKQLAFDLNENIGELSNRIRKIEAEIEAEEHSLKTYFKDNTCSEQREIRQWHEGALNALRRTLRILDGDI